MGALSRDVQLVPGAEVVDGLALRASVDRAGLPRCGRCYEDPSRQEELAF